MLQIDCPFALDIVCLFIIICIQKLKGLDDTANNVLSVRK